MSYYCVNSELSNKMVSDQVNNWVGQLYMWLFNNLCCCLHGGLSLTTRYTSWHTIQTCISYIHDMLCFISLQGTEVVSKLYAAHQEEGSLNIGFDNEVE